MLSLKDRIALLESDVLADPPRISVYRDFPFAILRYDPHDEWQVQREARLLTARLENAGKKVVTVSMAELLWEAIEAAEGIDTIVELEKDRGFEAAEEQVNCYLSDPDWRSLPELLAERLAGLDPRTHVVFLVRAAAMAPSIYPLSRLLDEMHGRTEVPTVLFYPGILEGVTGLRFMRIGQREASGSYRVKIY
ncbi:MAG: BREX protein BrxB domain-containing protein [Bacteroidota bacterium]